MARTKPKPRETEPRTKPTRSSASRVTGTAEAKKTAAVVLEALAGMRTPAAAGASLGISTARYYVLEMRALQGVVSALEPRARGRALTAARRVQGLEREKTKLTHEVLRTQGLLRAAQRALGIVPGPVVATPGQRRRRASVRGASAAATLRRMAEGSDDQARDEARSSGGPDGPGPAA